MAEFQDAVDYGKRLNEKLRRIKNLEYKVQQQARQLKDKHKKLKRNYHQLQEHYSEICSENKFLNSKI